MKRSREVEKEYWENLDKANELMERLSDGRDANDPERTIISNGFSAVKTMLKDILGSRELDASEYSPLPKGKTRHRRDLSDAQVQALERLINLKNLWLYQFDGRDMGERLLEYELIRQGLPRSREQLSSWLDANDHVNLYMPKIELADETIATLVDPTGLKVGGKTLTTITTGFCAIRDLLRESFPYKESNYDEEGKLVVNSKEELSKTQIEILSRLAEMQHIWLYMGWTDHYLPNALRDIGLPLTFSVNMSEDSTSVQRSLRRFLDA